MKRKILVIDDEPDVVRYLVSVLEDYGYQVESATSGEKGLELARDFKPDLVCLDIMMPRQSGISVYSDIRKDKATAKIPVIILTGIEKGDNFDFHEWVGDDSIPPPELFMEKPIKVGGFIEAVEGILSTGKVKS